MALHAVRFARPGGRTLVDAFTRVPFTLLQRIPGGGAAYRVAVSVKDSAGLELFNQSWTQSVADGMLEVLQGSAVELFTFAIEPGRYTVDVAITDSATGRVGRGTVAVQGFPAWPAASDLLLATSMRAAAGAGDTIPAPGEMAKGSVFLRATPWPALTPQQATLGYYLELYGAREDTAVLRFEVRGPTDALVVRLQEQRIPLDTAGRQARAIIDLAGLPPGHYRLVANLAGAAGDPRSAGFDMRGFGTGAAVEAASASGPVDRYAGRSETQLDSLYGPLIYIMSSDEQGLYTGLTIEGKRNFLRRFWTKRDPTAGTPLNEAEAGFYARIAEVDREFREGGSARVPGWRTDRGRIFIKYGPPDEVLSRPQAGGTNPYVVWKYTRGRPLKYVFLDQTHFGNFAMIYTDDRREASRPNWQALLGPEGVLDVQRF